MWKPDVTYLIGERVTRNGCLFECTGTHYAKKGMLPETTRGLWKQLPNRSSHLSINQHPARMLAGVDSLRNRIDILHARASTGLRATPFDTISTRSPSFTTSPTSSSSSPNSGYSPATISSSLTSQSLDGSSAYDCKICLLPWIDNKPTATPCGHIFCLSCLEKVDPKIMTRGSCSVCQEKMCCDCIRFPVLNGDKYSPCPICRYPLTGALPLFI